MLDIVVPVYNEGQGILRLFDEIRDEIRTSKRVMIVYDLPHYLHWYFFCIRKKWF